MLPDMHMPAHNVERFPLIAYVHVPKAGGTTVNEVLWSCSPRGLKHYQEGVPRPKLLDVALRNDWLSGHIPREVFANALIWLGRPIEYFSAVREPVAQLLSHLNWAWEIHNRGADFLRGYPRPRLEVSEQVRATDFSKPSAIIELLLRLERRYLNCQARYILGAEYNTISDGELARRVASFTYIATEQDLPALYRAFGFAALPKESNKLRENSAQKYYFDTSVFESKEIVDFLAEHHSHDFRVYECILKTSWSAGSRHPIRPAFPFVTADNYDEQGYLANNPDVAKALKTHKTWRSGRDHFLACGRREQRRQLLLPPAEVPALGERAQIGGV